MKKYSPFASPALWKDSFVLAFIILGGTKTYIAADWDDDKAAIGKLKEWNDGEKWNLSFTDVHEATQSSDDSLNCSIKASLAKRMDMSKTFVLIVRTDTKTRRAGECTYCSNYNDGKCKTGRTIATIASLSTSAKKPYATARTSNSLFCIMRLPLIRAIKAYGTLQ